MSNECFEQLQKSILWSPGFNLPVGYGVDSNPNFELAVSQKILTQNDGPVLDFSAFVEGCLVKGKEPMRTPWPYRLTGNVSHDELIARASLGIFLAQDDLKVL